jgi:hypothetical protein
LRNGFAVTIIPRGRSTVHCSAGIADDGCADETAIQRL